MASWKIPERMARFWWEILRTKWVGFSAISHVWWRTVTAKNHDFDGESEPSILWGTFFWWLVEFPEKLCVKLFVIVLLVISRKSLENSTFNGTFGSQRWTESGLFTRNHRPLQESFHRGYLENIKVDHFKRLSTSLTSTQTTNRKNLLGMMSNKYVETNQWINLGSLAVSS